MLPRNQPLFTQNLLWLAEYLMLYKEVRSPKSRMYQEQVRRSHCSSTNIVIAYADAHFGFNPFSMNNNKFFTDAIYCSLN